MSGGTNFKTLIGIDGIPRHACQSSPLSFSLSLSLPPWRKASPLGRKEKERERERERARTTKSLYTVEKRGCISQSHLSIIIIDEHVAAAARCTAIAADGGYTSYPRKHEAKRYQRPVDTAAPEWDGEGAISGWPEEERRERRRGERNGAAGQGGEGSL